AFAAPGSGDAAPEGGAAGAWSFDGLVRGDLAAVGETLRGRFDGPLVLVGHGLGGLAACASAGSGALEPDALVLFGVNVWLPGLDASPLRRLLKASLLTRGPAAKLLGRAPSDGAPGSDPFRALLESMPFGAALGSTPFGAALGGTPFGAALGRALTHARALAGATPWGTLWPDAARWWSADAWLDASGYDYLASLRRVRCPALAFSSHADPLLCAPECAHAFATRLGATRLEHHVAGGPGWRGPGHGGLVADGRAEPLWHRAADWLDAFSPGART
ncbi:MAG TPA: hypothetical protein VFS00_34620, partial [Polyangiaceae bacterium]|nr:hypothetical protein [Polyangiaceae bacterium]